MNRIISAVALALMIATPAYAGYRDQASKLISIYNDLDDACRGSQSSDESCAARTKVGELLDDYGWCNRKEGQATSEMAWHKCTKNSERLR